MVLDGSWAIGSMSGALHIPALFAGTITECPINS